MEKGGGGTSVTWRRGDSTDVEGVYVSDVESGDLIDVKRGGGNLSDVDRGDLSDVERRGGPK